MRFNRPEKQRRRKWKKKMLFLSSRLFEFRWWSFPKIIADARICRLNSDKHTDRQTTAQDNYPLKKRTKKRFQRPFLTSKNERREGKNSLFSRISFLFFPFFIIFTEAWQEVMCDILVLFTRRRDLQSNFSALTTYSTVKVVNMCSKRGLSVCVCAKVIRRNNKAEQVKYVFLAAEERKRRNRNTKKEATQEILPSFLIRWRNKKEELYLRRKVLMDDDDAYFYFTFVIRVTTYTWKTFFGGYWAVFWGWIERLPLIGPRRKWLEAKRNLVKPTRRRSIDWPNRQTAAVLLHAAHSKKCW